MPRRTSNTRNNNGNIRINRNTRLYRYNRNNEIDVDDEEEEDPQKCSKCEKFLYCTAFVGFAVTIGVAGIRYFAEVTPEQYYFPCNNTDIIPSEEITILKEEKQAYEKIIHDNKQSSSKLLSGELRNIEIKWRDVAKKIDLQDCYRQKCAKINIGKNVEAIKDKTLTISTWLFRAGAILLLLSGICCYYKRTLLGWGFGSFVLIVVGPIFINACISLYDYFVMQKFKVKC